MSRNQTRTVNVNGISIGGANPVVVQSMTNTDTKDLTATTDQIKRLAERGCELVRVAVPDKESARKLGQIVSLSPVPIVADIHYDWRLALKALDSGVGKLRLNPGNITDPDKIVEVAQKAKAQSVPIRVGVNSGSLPRAILEQFERPSPEAMVKSAEREIDILKEGHFQDIVVSLKSSDVPTMIEANKLFAEKYDFPLHLGVTEAGGGQQGIIKSALGIGTLLHQGIGDTIRVSLTGSPEREVKAAYDILRSLHLRKVGIEFISCPTCGRTEIDVLKVVEKLETILSDINKPLRVSVMGCSVNGIGEARESDIGVVGVRKGALLYRRGKRENKFSTKNAQEIALSIEKAVRSLLNERKLANNEV